MLTFDVITPTALRATLQRTCRSLDHQPFTGWRHLVMVDKPPAELSAADRALLEAIEHPRRQIRYCDRAHCDFGNSCRWSAWEYSSATYILYLDDDDYYLGNALGLLHDAISRCEVPPVWGVFPVRRFGTRFFNLPPAKNDTCSNQFFAVRAAGDWEVR